MEYFRYASAIAANSTAQHILNGYPMAGPTASFRRFRAALLGQVVGEVRMTVQCGQRMIYNDIVVPSIPTPGKEPIEPDDFHFGFVAYPGEVVVINIRNCTAGSLTPIGIFKAETLAVRRR